MRDKYAFTVGDFGLIDISNPVRFLSQQPSKTKAQAQSDVPCLRCLRLLRIRPI